MAEGEGGMIIRLVKLAIIIVAVYAFMHNPSATAHNVRVAGTAAINILGTVAERAGQFVEALLKH
jgi:hypothetical protein